MRPPTFSSASIVPKARVPRALRAQNWASPQVEEQYGSDRTRLTLALTDIDGQNVRQDVPQESMDDKIEKLIRNNPSITAKEMAEHLKVNEKTIRRHIKKMKHINYIGSGFSGHWEIIDEE
jgi:predicted HTH transcriptional regulator